jgi:hypothetical protein
MYILKLLVEEERRGLYLIGSIEAKVFSEI